MINNCNPNICACRSEIDNLKESNKELWEKMDKLNEKNDRILMRINVILGGIAVACVLLALNIALK